MRAPEELALIASIADDLPAGVWVAAVPSGAFVYANRAFEEIMGMRALPDVVAGECSAPYGIFTRTGEPYPEDRLPFVRALRARAVVVVDDIAIHRRDGHRVYVRAHGKPIFDAAGEMTHIVIAFFDITREVQAERDAAVVREQLGEVVHGAPITLSAFDASGIITLVAGRALAALGRPAEAYLGTSMLESYGPEVAAYARRALAGEPITYTLEFEGRSYEARLTPRRNEAGVVIGAIGVSFDVTEARRAQAKLAQAERLASLGLLAAGVAHEINNPLSYVIGNLDVIARSLESGQRDLGGLSSLVHEARDGAERVRSIVRDLKTFSRVDEVRARHVDVRGPLEAAIAMVRNEVRHRAKLVVDIPPGLHVRGSEGRLAQLFLNLLINAAHALEPGAADRNEIAVTVRSTGDHVAVEVRDTGVGILPEVLPRIFDPFFTTKAGGGGTGLGLSMSQAIATDLGGSIEAESEPGRGTLMRVSLPVAPPLEDEEPRVAPLPSRAAPRRGSVLIVDDEPGIGRSIRLLLRNEQDVVYETRGAGALDRLRRGERFDVILCDIMMPEMTGIDLYAHVRALAPDQAAAIIFLSGGAVTDRAHEFLASVENLVIEKPFDPREFVATIRNRVG
ncbi:MAG TPA: ATP-binding protein [Polyangiaceae bacterium]|nr:ATP-binding protein [Polyangiaceae bacterium]